MSDARVTSIDAIVAFRGAVRTFEEDAAQAILSLDEQSRRALDWIEHDAAPADESALTVRVNGVFDFDDVGAPVREECAGRWREHELSHLEDTHALQWWHAVSARV